MKIHLLSDLHAEFESYEYRETDSELVVLAGDTNVKEKGVDWALEVITKKPVMYVLGNHEYYGSAYPKLVKVLKDKCKNTNVHILENDVFTYQDVNIFGCTLWTDFKLFGDPRIAGYECQQVMSDYKKIRVSPKYSKLRSIDVATIHSRSLSWLESEISKYAGGKNVVVSHHAPSPNSLPGQNAEEYVSAAYASQLEGVVEKYKPQVWIHGHVHNSVDYLMGSCRIVCNPRGYPDERNPDFDSELVVEV